MTLRIVHLFFLISLAFCQVDKPIVLSIFKIDNVNNEIDEKEIRQFKTGFEVALQEHSSYLTLIAPEFDEVLIESIKRSLAHITEKDLFLAGELENEDIIIKIDLYKIKKRRVGLLYKCDLRMRVVKTGVGIGPLVEEGKDIEDVATAIANDVFQKLWQGVVTIQTNKQPYTLIINDTEKQTVQVPALQIRLMKGTNTIRLEKKGFRAIEDKFEIKPGEAISKPYNFIRRGANVTIEGSPRGATILLKKGGDQYTGSLPYRNTLPEGSYSLFISHPGYVPGKGKIQVKDKEDIVESITLLPINFNSIRNKSLLFPGLGQYFFGDKKKGGTFIVGEGVALALTASTAIAFYLTKKDRDRDYDKYQNGMTQLHSQIRNKEDRMRILSYSSWGLFTLCTGLYFYNLYDIYQYRELPFDTNLNQQQNQYDQAFDELEDNLDN